MTNLQWTREFSIGLIGEELGFLDSEISSG
jgi:hypothetical protein